MLSPAKTLVKVVDARGELITVSMADGRLEPRASHKELCAVFCTPPSTWWNDVHYACSTIQLCTTRDEAEHYHERHGFGKGDVMDVETLWKLSVAWYGDKHTYEYARKTPEEVKDLYSSLGLVSSYWSS
ncbi:alkylmercury lyase domain-containing protein [Diaporthe amygdali]|uniref:alkylmercury lyase domain-containing protein n=1 Tax=Phomopsis amygdali TaxID=1214568 RepID=UPI0022FEA9B5|nr:alkylmercury lyase domain-containing protein [Diaporthe amygdali]KAJ0122508.1 alkylmercury lyase domain-containing protein [Diaporthe amygdali]